MKASALTLLFALSLLAGCSKGSSAPEAQGTKYEAPAILNTSHRALLDARPGDIFIVELPEYDPVVSQAYIITKTDKPWLYYSAADWPLDNEGVYISNSESIWYLGNVRPGNGSVGWPPLVRKVITPTDPEYASVAAQFKGKLPSR